MQISGSRTFRAPQEVVWDKLLNPDIIAGCIPGCEKFEAVGEECYQATMRVGIAAIKGTYSGSVQIADKEPPIRYKLIVEGGGTPGRMKGEGVITLSTRDDSTTEVSYQGDVQVIGPLAGVGQRLLGAAARMLIDQFFKCMEQSVTSN